MPVPTPQLPDSPPTPFVKPTHANTHGGKRYIPTHPELFRVEFSAPSGRLPNGLSNEHLGETFSSRLVSTTVSPMSSLELNTEPIRTSPQILSSLLLRTSQ